ncbi:sugar ABC transporter permease [Hoeflea sp. WL0058]|uniref:Sugar ABC transporter permease n=1 Tax=Flavimaribacter sediminis TaxID=2865987 RepID=A0AAE2ZMV6_9HYPH|nr:sugar ABC transporter permease [Flavimaribacter sediminis]MBW8639829.1 sugar ABC transporter permease [Flavimaribacter sediminis]
MSTSDSPREGGWVAAAIGPALILLLLTAYIPIIYALTLAFYNKTAFNPDMDFVGLKNFFWLLKRDDLWAALGKSIVFTLGSVGFQLAFGLFFGLLLNEAIRGRAIMRSLVILPYLLPTIVIGLVFRWILNPEFGVVNQILLSWGVVERPINFFGGLDVAMTSIIVTTGWQYGSFAVLLILARLQSINPRLYEAARSCGAGTWRCFVDVTLPNLRTTLLLIALLRGIWMFNKFDLIWIITKGGPLQATETLPIYVYKIAFQDFNFGRAAAGCFVMFVILLVVSLIYFKYFNPTKEIEVNR